MDFSEPKALLFDVFGTVVDWRGSIIAEGRAWNDARGAKIDWTRGLRTAGAPLTHLRWTEFAGAICHGQSWMFCTG
jgi:hypothetical protein